MKKLLLLSTALFTTIAFGQKINDKPSGNNLDEKNQQKVDRNKLYQESAFFVDGQFVIYKDLMAIKPEKIAFISVKKSDTLINSKLYHGQMFIKTKESSVPRSMSYKN
jgi:hypothetical protein